MPDAPLPTLTAAGAAGPGGRGGARSAAAAASGTGGEASGGAEAGRPASGDGAAGAARLDKSSGTIRDMFGQVARRYDLLNHLLSGGFDFLWRRRAAAALAPSPGPPGSPVSPLTPGARVLDLCAGTGDQAVTLWRRRGARVAAADFCLPMLALARHKFARLRRRTERRTPPAPPARPAPSTRVPGALAADALALPFAPGTFAAATVAFGLRNVADLDRALRQLAQALAPGGTLVVLECALPARAPLRALYLLYFRRVLPLIGRLLSDSSSAYDYLPSSVLAFPQRQAFLDLMAAAGFTALSWEDLTAGTVCLYRGTVPGGGLRAASAGAGGEAVRAAGAEAQADGTPAGASPTPAGPPAPPSAGSGMTQAAAGA